jgi:hypothetical protein
MEVPPEDPWAGSTDEEFLSLVTAFEAKLEKAACLPASVLQSNKMNKFEQFHREHISSALVEDWREKGHKLSFSNQGCFTIFYDAEKADCEWEKAKVLYDAGHLPGITKIARANQELSPGNGVAFCFFSGPASQEKFLLEVGRCLLVQLQFTRQSCSAGYPAKIYYKLRKKTPLYYNGPCFYAVPY